MEDKIRVRKIKHQDLTNYLITRDGRIFNSKIMKKQHILKMDI